MTIGESLAQPLLLVLWRSPFPATLQDLDFRIVDVNQAYLEYTGLARDKLIGIDPIELQPREDRAANAAARVSVVDKLRRDEVLPLIERRLIDASGRERWFRAAPSRVQDDRGRPLYLVVMQDCTAEHVEARAVVTHGEDRAGLVQVAEEGDVRVAMLGGVLPGVAEQVLEHHAQERRVAQHLQVGFDLDAHAALR